MAKRKRLTKKQLIYGGIAALVAATIVIWLFAFFGPSPQTAAPAAQERRDTVSEEAPAESSEPLDDVPAEDPVPTIDPSTVARIDVEPLELSVAYVRGVPGFGFSVERTANGTRYVEFSSESLIGTKCTDDVGAFASIIVDPTDQDTPTVSQTKVVGGTTYGLSLPDDTCTADAALFVQYQAAFRDAFSLLERLSADTV